MPTTATPLHVHGEQPQAPSFVGALRARNLLTHDQAARCARAQAESGDGAIRVLERLGFVEPRVLAGEVARHFGLRMLEESEWPARLILADQISPRFLRDHRLLPLRTDDSGLMVAIADPEDGASLSALAVAAERPVVARIAPGGAILSALDRLLSPDANPAQAAAGPTLGVSEDDVELMKDLALEAPVIEYVDRLFREAAANRATDLHIEPARGRVVLRRRIDGMLMEAGTLAPEFGRAVVSRIKILSRLNIAERRLPQDGRARIRITDRDQDLRIASMPTIHGEGLAIRLLAGTDQVPQLDDLGLTSRDLNLLAGQIALPHGLIVVTGPTGSGKTTTLAALLERLNDPNRKIVTIEDPVEYQIDGITQIQVKSEIGLSFAHTLRSLLRFDPDVMMIGEMRDAETARIGIHAALTGHLVLTTLHTNSAAAAISRLLDLEVQGYLIASTLRCVVAQRLVRRLCRHCREPYDCPAEPLAQLAGSTAGTERLWRAKGCAHCAGTGFRGRAAVFEVLVADDAIRALMRPEIGAGQIAAEARRAGMTTMIEDGLAKCRDGLTTLEEVGRVALER